jgi:2'-hydroxyisoflavone reductase
MDRRDFLRRSAIVGGGMVGTAAAGPLLASSTDPTPARGQARVGTTPRRPGTSLRILVLGGTGFIGPHVVRRALAGGHQVSMFNRGQTDPRLYGDLFDNVESLVGDRNDDISALEGGRWDAVIDNSGYTPDQVRPTAQLLRGSVDQYIFTSTRGAYADYTHPVMDEDAPLGVPGVPMEEWSGYGPLKAAAEHDVHEAFPQGATIVRPPIITGPGDNTDRFTYWYLRVRDGGEVLAPGDPTDPIQYVDVRDLADFMLHLAETRTAGVFNTVAPASPMSSAEFLYGLRATTGEPVRFTWVDWDFLEDRGLRGGQELPAWRPPRGDNLNYGRVDNRRAIAAGMTFRPLAVTAMDTVAWWDEARADPEGPRAGISREEEARVLAEWAANQDQDQDQAAAPAGRRPEAHASTRRG